VAGAGLSRARSHRVLRSFRHSDIGRSPAAPSPAATDGGDSEYAYNGPTLTQCRNSYSTVTIERPSLFSIAYL
jgi:hypothetical protein